MQISNASSGLNLGIVDEKQVNEYPKKHLVQSSTKFSPLFLSDFGCSGLPWHLIPGENVSCSARLAYVLLLHPSPAKNVALIDTEYSWINNDSPAQISLSRTNGPRDSLNGKFEMGKQKRKPAEYEGEKA